MGQRVMMPGGQIAEFPDGMPQDAIERAVRTHLGVKTPEPEPEKPKQDDHSPLVGGILDTFGMTDRPGAVPLTGNETTKTPLGVILKPEGGLERAASAAVQVPATALAPFGMAGRVAVQGLISAAENASKGKGALSWDTLIDTAVAGGAELLTGGLSKALKSASAPVRGYERGTKMLGEALEYVEDRLMKAKVIIPSIDPAKKLSWPEMIEALKGMKGEQYRVARAEVAAAMNLADKQELRPGAGTVFKEVTKTRGNFRMPPSQTAKTANLARNAVRNPATRATVDEAGRERYQDVPLGFYAWEALKSGGAAVAERIPGVGAFMKAAGTMLP